MIIASFVFLVGLLKRPFCGLLSYMIIMMIRPGLYYPILGKLRIELIVGILIMIILAFSPKTLARINFKDEPVTRWMFLFIGVMLISTVQSFDFSSSWETLIEFLKVFLFYLMIITLIENEKDVKIFLWAFIIITCALGYEAIYNFSHGIMTGNTGGNRTAYAMASTGMAHGHVGQANLLIQAVPFIWYLGVCQKSTIEKVSGLVLLCFAVFGVIVSASRGAMIGLVVMLILMTIFSKHRILMLLSGSLILISVFYYMGSDYQNYMSTILQGTGSGTSAESRLMGLEHGVEIMVKRPILGVGPGCYPIARLAWFKWGLWAHNHYGQLMGELGILGTIVWFGFLQSYLRKAANLMKVYEKDSERVNLFKAVIIISGVRLVIGMAAHSLYIFIWYLLAAIVAVSVWPSKDADQKD